VAEVHDTRGETGQAITMLKDLARDEAGRMQALVSLGDTYRRHAQYGAAVDAYDRALKATPKVTAGMWPVLYARGIARAQMDRWDLAEKDLLQALSFQPSNPMILNFLAYSWADQGV